MSKKSSVYFGAPLEALISSLSEGASVSGRLNQAAERYLEILRRHGLGLSEEESQILSNCLSGSWIDPLLIRHLTDKVEDSEFAGTKAAKTLIGKLRSASFADRVAIVERLGF